MREARTPLVALVALLALVLTACPADDPEVADGEALPGAGESISLWDGQWQSLDINNEVAAFILEHGYGYEVDSVVLGAPVMEQSLPEGDIDAALELWAVNRVEWYERVTGDGTVVDVGPIIDLATQGYYVPRYVIEGDDERGIEASAPDLASVFDLADYVDVFEDPEDPGMGGLISCPPEWECHAINEVKFGAYGLLDAFNVKSPGSPGALDAEMAGAYERGEPVVGYYWEPTALMGRFDFVKLDEPEWNEACEAANEEAREAGTDPRDAPEEAGCGFQEHTVNVGINADLSDRAPEAAEFLERIEVGTEALNATGAYMEEEEVEADQGAIWFFENYDHWRDWIDGDVLERVEQALQEVGADI